MVGPVHPLGLSWADVDPARHPFDSGSAAGVVMRLPAAGEIPVRPPGTAADPQVIAWAAAEGDRWVEAMTRQLVDHYGRWAAGWHWARAEGDLGGGPVRSWCCARDSIGGVDDTLAVVAVALCEWRGWLEDLAARFTRHRLAPHAMGVDRSRVWHRAVVELVTVLVDRTDAGDAWHAHCAQILTWFLTRWGVSAPDAVMLVGEAIGGRFHSWVAPGDETVDMVARRLAASGDPG